jgi:hypothetical protein
MVKSSASKILPVSGQVKMKFMAQPYFYQVLPPGLHAESGAIRLAPSLE